MSDPGAAPRVAGPNVAPSVLNYFIGKGIVKWQGSQPVAESTYTDLGNAPTFELTPTVTRLPHYSSRAGIRLMDLNVNIERALAVRMHLEEVTSYNLALALMGSLAPGAVPGTDPDVIDIMNLGQVVGALRLVGTNDIGQNVQIDLPYVSIAPTAAIPFIGDNAWMFLEVTGEVFIDATGSFGTINCPITGEVTTLTRRGAITQQTTTRQASTMEATA